MTSRMIRACCIRADGVCRRAQLSSLAIYATSLLASWQRLCAGDLLVKRVQHDFGRSQKSKQETRILHEPALYLITGS